MRCDWGSNWEYPCMEQYVLSKICSDNRTESISSSIRRIWWSLQRVKMVGWPEPVACCHVRIFRYFVSKPIAILETTGRLQLLSLQICADNYLRKWLLCSLLDQEPSHASYLAVSTAAGILIHENNCRTLCLHHSQCFSTVVGTATHWHFLNCICCIVPNTFLANHMPFHASTINDYRRLTPVATPPEKGRRRDGGYR